MLDNKSILNDKRFYIDERNYERVLSGSAIYHYKFKSLKLKKLKLNYGGQKRILTKVSAYEYLLGNTDAYEEYCTVDCNNAMFRSKEEYDRLINSFDNYNYDPRRGIVIIDQHNYICDGQHRCCIMLNRYGGDYKIQVLKVYFYEQRFVNKLLRKVRKIIKNV